MVTKQKRRLFVEMISDAETGRVSHKRVLSVLSFIVLVVLTALNIFDKKADEILLDSLIYDYEQSDSGINIVDSLAYKYNLKQQDADREEYEESRDAKEY